MTSFPRAHPSQQKNSPDTPGRINIEDKRARDRAKERGLGLGTKRTAEGRLVEGQVTTNWKQALAQLALAYPERINPYL